MILLALLTLRSLIPVVGALPTEMPPECSDGSTAVYPDGSRFVCEGGTWAAQDHPSTDTT